MPLAWGGGPPRHCTLLAPAAISEPLHLRRLAGPRPSSIGLIRSLLPISEETSTAACSRRSARSPARKGGSRTQARAALFPAGILLASDGYRIYNGGKVVPLSPLPAAEEAGGEDARASRAPFFPCPKEANSGRDFLAESGQDFVQGTGFAGAKRTPGGRWVTDASRADPGVGVVAAPVLYNPQQFGKQARAARESLQCSFGNKCDHNLVRYTSSFCRLLRVPAPSFSGDSVVQLLQ
jgi:hypothetical protein